MVTYSAKKHFKNGNWVVDSYARELLENGELGKIERVPILYANQNGVWVEVNIRW